VLHTAEWIRDTDFKDKKMALIGIGSSGMQTLSKLQAQAKHVDVYVKSETYIVPPFAGIERDRFFGFTDGLKAGMISEDPARINPAYTQEQKDRFEKDPVYLQQHRKQVLAELNGAYYKGVTRKGSAVSQDFKAMVHEMTNLKLGARPATSRAMTERHF
jgi:cation diffusion facilitator CzcD-associated flavoprotein CzcO